MLSSESSTSDHNAEEIARLQRWRGRVNLIFFASLVEIPIGIVVPCVAVGIINLQKLGLLYAQIAMLCAILLPLVGLAGLLLMRFDRKRSWRCLQLARMADDLGLGYTHKPELDEYAMLHDFQFINLERVMNPGVASNLVAGTFKKRPILAADYSYNHFYGNRVHNTEQTVVVFTDGFDGLPDFVVVKQWFGESLEQLIAGTPFGKKFEVPGEDEFNDRFTLAGSNRKAVLACLTEEVIDLVVSNAGLTFLIQDGKLLVARQSKLVSETEYEDFLSAASQLARALQHSQSE